MDLPRLVSPGEVGGPLTSLPNDARGAYDPAAGAREKSAEVAENYERPSQSGGAVVCVAMNRLRLRRALKSVFKQTLKNCLGVCEKIEEFCSLPTLSAPNSGPDASVEAAFKAGGTGRVALKNYDRRENLE
jgi:hypothetical protein